MKKAMLIMVLFAACSTPQERKAVVNLTSPDKILWRQCADMEDTSETFITLKDSCIYVTRIYSGGGFGYHKQIYCY